MKVESKLVTEQRMESFKPLTLKQLRGLFIGASATYPASIFAQSAFMLLQLRRRRENPESMHKLLESPSELEKIVIAAKKKHGRKVNAYVTPEVVKSILIAEVKLMTDLQKVHDSGLHNILTVYPKLSKKPEEYSQFVDQLIVSSVL